jgi:hypothetical protein
MIPGGATDVAFTGAETGPLYVTSGNGSLLAVADASGL